MTRTGGVSVLLLTKNGRAYLGELLESVKAQDGWSQSCEIIAVDSGSRDGTLEMLGRFGARVVRIPAAEFSHGRTRNLAAGQAKGEYLVFLTQDATPANARWLARLLSPLREDAEIAGAYSRHLPRPRCHPMEWRRIVEMEFSGRPDSSVNRAVGNPDYDRNPAFFYFFSNVSSALRRTVWERFPFPEVEFGEDQLWARRVLEQGYKTAYCADSLVFHSHGYGPWANFRRHFDHARAFRDVSGRRPPQVALGTLARAAVSAAADDLRFWRRERGQSKYRVWFRWGAPALGWHLAALLGTWVGERSGKLPCWSVGLLSYHERIKRQ